MPELVLLTHATELSRPTNTGRLVVEAASESLADPLPWKVRTVLWQRKEPEQALLHCLQSLTKPGQYVLLYPAADACMIDVDSADSGATADATGAAKPELPAGFILLDATWQQAQKMYNQSPYLHPLIKWQLCSRKPSAYLLRRNQKQEGWCTAELVQMLWQYSGASQAANALAAQFSAFNRR